MKEGNIIITGIPQSDGSLKMRLALILKQLPKYRDLLVCGISTQLHQYVENFDEILNEKSKTFNETGLHKTSLIRLSFLAVISNDKIPGSIGKIDLLLHKELLKRLSDFLRS